MTRLRSENPKCKRRPLFLLWSDGSSGSPSPAVSLPISVSFTSRSSSPPNPAPGPIWPDRPSSSVPSSVSPAFLCGSRPSASRGCRRPGKGQRPLHRFPRPLGGPGHPRLCPRDPRSGTDRLPAPLRHFRLRVALEPSDRLLPAGRGRLRDRRAFTGRGRIPPRPRRARAERSRRCWRRRGRAIRRGAARECSTRRWRRS